MSLVRWIGETCIRVACYVKRGRRIRPDPRTGPVKVNLGAGLAVAPGWVNVDASPNALAASWPRAAHAFLFRLSGAHQYYSFEQYHAILRAHRFLHHDLADGIPFADETVDALYSSHFLEHVTKEHAAHLMREMHRVLKKDGRVRLAVPDLAFAMALYARGEKERMLDKYFFVDVGEMSLSHHRYMYDFEMLEKMLREARFSGIVRCDRGRGETPDLALLDSKSEDTLFVEAVKV